MKKLFALLLAFSFVFCGIFLIGCADNTPPVIVDFEGSVTIVLKSESVIVSYEADLSAEDFTTASSVYDVLKFLKEKAGLIYAESGSGNTVYLDSIGPLNPASANEFVEFFTSVEKDFGVWEGASAIEYGGVSLKSAGVGIAQASIGNGAVMLFKITAFA